MAWIGCWKCNQSVKDTDATCKYCGASLARGAREAELAPTLSMPATTTPTLEGKRINAYKGIVASEAIVGINALKDLFASFRDAVGGRSGTYEKELIRARQAALAEMMQQAAGLGANAVVGVE